MLSKCIVNERGKYPRLGSLVCIEKRLVYSRVCDAGKGYWIGAFFLFFFWGGGCAFPKPQILKPCHVEAGIFTKSMVLDSCITMMQGAFKNAST